jgi:hypothetical protein
VRVETNGRDFNVSEKVMVGDGKILAGRPLNIARETDHAETRQQAT